MSAEGVPAQIVMPDTAVADSEAAAHQVATQAMDAYTADGSVAMVREALCDGLTLGEAVEDWQDRLDAWNRRGQVVMLWGEPASAAAFLALMDMGVPVDALITSTTGFLAPSGVPLRTVARLVEDPPDVVITLGPDEVPEVRASLEGHGIAARVYALA